MKSENNKDLYLIFDYMETGNCRLEIDLHLIIRSGIL